MTPDEIKKGIDALKMCRSLITFNPMTGEEIDPIFLNEDNRDLYTGIGITLTHIQQLEARNNVLYYALVGVMHTVCKWVDGASYDPDVDTDGSIAINMAAQAREVVLKAIDHLESKEKHAYWMGGSYCSNCRAMRSRLWAGYLEPNANTFCHVCGARMDAKEESNGG